MQSEPYKETIKEKIKSKIADIGWIMFLWGREMTQEEYWQIIYNQEKNSKI